MNALEYQDVVSPAQYLEIEMATPERHEYIGGRVYAMAGGTNEHATICHNLGGVLFALLRDKKCRGGGSEQRVRIEKSGDAFYPDGLIQCPPLRFDPSDPNGLLNPRAVFEVLSPSTEVMDRGIKFESYRSIDECSDYVLISSRRILIQHYRRSVDGEWALKEYVWRRESLVLNNFEISIPLDDLYRDLELPEGMLLVG